ncbi:zinc finger protein ZAT12-like [Panicum miliaceum]|uniref:Zinc finger protein ZAT12-like n=1 Tax=Panicum miliaceum TaxID=4540 RepID=A0A3L6PKM6_PANMI|nr:zinc finger protein ZAT12-like [Panicum miliaceum]
MATARNAPAASTANRLLLLFSLSLSPASKVITKGGGGRRLGAAAAAAPFRCRTCGRSFATFQALGGHRTSHNRPRVRADGLDLLLGARPGKGAAMTDAHQCNACGMVFPTGQALGGHMRRHRAAAALDVAPLEATPPAPTVSGLSEEGDDENYYTGHMSSTLIQFI